MCNPGCVILVCRSWQLLATLGSSWQLLAALSCLAAPGSSLPVPLDWAGVVDKAIALRDLNTWAMHLPSRMCIESSFFLAQGPYSPTTFPRLISLGSILVNAILVRFSFPQTVNHTCPGRNQPGAARNQPGAARNCQEQPGRQELSGTARKLPGSCQKQPGAAARRNSQVLPGAATRALVKF